MTMSQADRLTAIVLAALGLAMAVGGYTMDRLEIRQIHPASIPGLVPMILGVLMVICAALLFRDGARAASEESSSVFASGSWMRLGLTAALTLAYAIVLLGWLPYFWATVVFVFAFAALFSWPAEGSTRARLICLGSAALLALAASWGTTALFSEVFLVRLP